MTRFQRRVVRGALAALGVLVAGGALFALGGGYNVAATSQHIAPVYALLDFASQRSIALRARAIDAPMSATPAALERGLQLYAAHCVQCHGAPGIAPLPFALGLTPSPANLALKAREKTPSQLFWAIKYGLKMTAMPAWEFRLSDADLWALTAFVGELQRLSPEDWRRRVAAEPALDPAMALSADAMPARADADRGKVALQQYLCTTCHAIPGVVSANNPVGPSLAGLASRNFLAGILPNSPENLVAWLRSPQRVAPRSAMPDLYVSERDARDMAAFLGTLR